MKMKEKKNKVVETKNKSLLNYLGDNFEFPERSGSSEMELYKLLRDNYELICMAANRAKVMEERANEYQIVFSNIAQDLQFYIGWKDSGLDYSKFISNIRRKLSYVSISNPFISNNAHIPVKPIVKKELISMYKKALNTIIDCSLSYNVLHFDFEIIIDGLKVLFYEGKPDPSFAQIEAMLSDGGIFMKYPNTDFRPKTRNKVWFESLKDGIEDTPHYPGIFKFITGTYDLWGSFRGRETESVINKWEPGEETVTA